MIVRVRSQVKKSSTLLREVQAPVELLALLHEVLLLLLERVRLHRSAVALALQLVHRTQRRVATAVRAGLIHKSSK